MTTPILGLPELESAQNQKYLTVNSALSRLDVLVNLTVFNRTVTAPPGSPSDGHRYIVAATATGAFTGQEGNIAAYVGSNWIFFTPSEGWRAYDQGANQFIIFNGSAWVLADLSSSSLSDGSVTLLGVGAIPDTTNRLSVKSPGVLFDAGTDDFTLTLNKVTAGDDLQIILQTGFSTRAQIGLLTNDDLVFKVSPDGSSFFTGITIDKDTGNVAIGAGSDANNKLLVAGSSALFTSSGDFSFVFSKGTTGDDASITFQNNFSSRWLVGLLGNDDLTFKYTPDGTNFPWPPAAIMKNKSGRIIFKKAQNGEKPWDIVKRNHVTSSSWLSSTSAADNQWRSVAWSPELGLFAAVSLDGTGNRVMTSPDGINWTIRTSAADNQWSGVAWSPELGLFAAVAITGTGNRVMTSPDGINWTIRTSAADNGWLSVAWSPELGLFAAVAITGTGNRVMTSPDGINWTIRTSAADNQWRSVAWSPELGLFAAVSNTGTGNRVMTSPDGINWTIRTSAADNGWLGVAWSPELGLFAAVALTGTGNRVMTSPDGINWTIRTSAIDNNWSSVAWSPELGLFAAVANSGTGNRVMTSPDGINWTIRTSAIDNQWSGVAWSPELGLFAAVSLDGTGNRVMTSVSGNSFVYRS